jgi:hypothetical protein
MRKNLRNYRISLYVKKIKPKLEEKKDYLSLNMIEEIDQLISSCLETHDFSIIIDP